MLNRDRRWLGGRRARVRVASAILVLLATIAATTAWPTWARKRGRPMPFEEVATTWVGLSASEQYLVRLVLEEDRTGTGGYTFLDEEPRTFRISSWSYDAGRIEIEPVPPAGPPSWVSSMQGSILGLTMHLEASGDDWKINFVLRREAELEQRWNLLKRQMEGEESQ